MAAPEKQKIRNVSPMQKGSLVMWNDTKGFGFIRSSQAEDYFVHISNFKQGLTRRPVVGDEIQFRAAEGPGKKRVLLALIPSLLETGSKPVSPFALNPRQRSWLTNVLIITPLVLSGYLLLLAKNPIPFFSYWMLSLLTMFLYGTDKANAATRKWRVPESYFHLLELMGGWPGALIAQNDFRHKTRASTYLWILRGIIAIHLMGWFIYFYWTAKQTEISLF